MEIDLENAKQEALKIQSSYNNMNQIHKSEFVDIIIQLADYCEELQDLTNVQIEEVFSALQSQNEEEQDFISAELIDSFLTNYVSIFQNISKQSLPQNNNIQNNRQINNRQSLYYNLMSSQFSYSEKKENNQEKIVETNDVKKISRDIISNITLEKLKELKQLFHFCNMNNEQQVEFSQIMTVVEDMCETQFTLSKNEAHNIFSTIKNHENNLISVLVFNQLLTELEKIVIGIFTEEEKMQSEETESVQDKLNLTDDKEDDELESQYESEIATELNVFDVNFTNQFTEILKTLQTNLRNKKMKNDLNNINDMKNQWNIILKDLAKIQQTLSKQQNEKMMYRQKDDINQEKILMYKNQILELEEQNKDIFSQINQLEDIINYQEQQLQLKQREIIKIEKTTETKIIEHQTNQQELQTLKEEVSTMKKETRKLKKEKNILQQNNEMLEKYLNEDIETTKTHQQEEEKQNSDLTHLKTENNQLIIQLQSTQEELTEVNNAYQILSTEKKELYENILILTKEIENLKIQNTRHEETELRLTQFTQMLQNQKTLKNDLQGLRTSNFLERFSQRLSVYDQQPITHLQLPQQQHLQLKQEMTLAQQFQTSNIQEEQIEDEEQIYENNEIIQKYEDKEDIVESEIQVIQSQEKDENQLNQCNTEQTIEPVDPKKLKQSWGRSSVPQLTEIHEYKDEEKEESNEEEKQKEEAEQQNEEEKQNDDSPIETSEKMTLYYENNQNSEQNTALLNQIKKTIYEPLRQTQLQPILEEMKGRDESETPQISEVQQLEVMEPYKNNIKELTFETRNTLNKVLKIQEIIPNEVQTGYLQSNRISSLARPSIQDIYQKFSKNEDILELGSFNVFQKDYFGLKQNSSVQKILEKYQDNISFGAIYTEKIYNLSKSQRKFERVILITTKNLYLLRKKSDYFVVARAFSLEKLKAIII